VGERASNARRARSRVPDGGPAPAPAWEWLAGGYVDDVFFKKKYVDDAFAGSPNPTHFVLIKNTICVK
jgi:hypothetical protein